MAYVVRRPGDRWEIRESTVTPAGPRARSLASFRILSADVLDRAASKACRPFDRDRVVASAHRAGVSIDDAMPDRLARQLLAELGRGRIPAPGLCRLLMRSIADHWVGAGAAQELRWLDASDEERGRALRELLDLGDRLPAQTRGSLQFPPLKSTRGSS
jgi:hypothetical protein